MSTQATLFTKDQVAKQLSKEKLHDMLNGFMLNPENTKRFNDFYPYSEEKEIEVYSIRTKRDGAFDIKLEYSYPREAIEHVLHEMFEPWGMKPVFDQAWTDNATSNRYYTRKNKRDSQYRMYLTYWSEVTNEEFYNGLNTFAKTLEQMLHLTSISETMRDVDLTNVNERFLESMFEMTRKVPTRILELNGVTTHIGDVIELTVLNQRTGDARQEKFIIIGEDAEYNLTDIYPIDMLAYENSNTYIDYSQFTYMPIKHMGLLRAKRNIVRVDTTEVLAYNEQRKLALVKDGDAAYKLISIDSDTVVTVYNNKRMFMCDMQMNDYELSIKFETPWEQRDFRADIELRTDYNWTTKQHLMNVVKTRIQSTTLDETEMPNFINYVNTVSNTVSALSESKQQLLDVYNNTQQA